MNDALVCALKQLRLSGALQSLEVRLHEARSNQLSHANSSNWWCKTNSWCVRIAPFDADSRLLASAS